RAGYSGRPRRSGSAYAADAGGRFLNQRCAAQAGRAGGFLGGARGGQQMSGFGPYSKLWRAALASGGIALSLAAPCSIIPVVLPARAADGAFFDDAEPRDVPNSPAAAPNGLAAAAPVRVDAGLRARATRAAEEKIRIAYDLAERRAYFSAHTEFVEAFRM